MPMGTCVGVGKVLAAAHRVQPLFEVSMIPFQAIIQIFRAPMLDLGQDYPKCWRVALRLVGHDTLGPGAGFCDGTLKKGACRCSVAPY